MEPLFYFVFGPIALYLMHLYAMLQAGCGQTSREPIRSQLQSRTAPGAKRKSAKQKSEGDVVYWQAPVKTDRYDGL